MAMFYHLFHINTDAEPNWITNLFQNISCQKTKLLVASNWIKNIDKISVQRKVSLKKMKRNLTLERWKEDHTNNSKNNQHIFWIHHLCLCQKSARSERMNLIRRAKMKNKGRAKMKNNSKVNEETRYAIWHNICSA